MELLRSTLEDDPDIAELLGGFGEQLARYAAELGHALGAGDLAALGRVAHRLAGAGGSYGFDEITACARGLESAVSESPGEPRALAEALVLLCERAAAGCLLAASAPALVQPR